VMGWEGYHLHAFTAPGGRCYGENGAAETVALAAVLPIHRPLTPDLVGVVRGELGLADPTHPGQHLAQHRPPRPRRRRAGLPVPGAGNSPPAAAPPPPGAATKPAPAPPADS